MASKYTTGKANLKNIAPFGFSDGDRILILRTDAWSPSFSSLESPFSGILGGGEIGDFELGSVPSMVVGDFISGGKKSRGGFGHSGDLRSRRAAGPGGAIAMVAADRKRALSANLKTKVDTVARQWL